MIMIQYDVRGSATWQINRRVEEFLKIDVRSQVFSVPGMPYQIVLVAGTEEELKKFDDYFDNGENTYCKVVGFHYVNETRFNNLMTAEKIKFYFGSLKDKLNFNPNYFL